MEGINRVLDSERPKEENSFVLKRNVVNQEPKSGSLIDRLIMIVLCSVVVVLPWLFTPFTYEYYEIAKNTFLIVAVVLLIVLWALKVAIKKEFVFVRTPFDLPIIIFLFLQIVSTIFSIYAQTSVWGYYSRFTGGLISTIALVFLYYFVVNNVNGKRKIKLILNSALVSICLLALFTVLNSLNLFNALFTSLSESSPSLSVLLSEAFTPVGNPNSLAFIFLLFLPLSLGKLISTDKVEKQILYIVSSCLLILALGFSSISTFDAYSVSMWLLASAVIVFFVFLTLSKEREALLSYVPIILVAIFSGIFAMSPSVRKTIAKDLNFSRYTQAPFNTTWSVVTGTIKEYKVGGFLVGTGPDTYAYNYPRFKPIEQNLEPNWRKNYTRSTNQLYEVLSNNGLLGFLSYLFLVAMIILFLVKKVFRNYKKLKTSTLLFLSLSVILLLVFNLLTFFTITLFLAFWLILSLTISSYNLLNPEDIEKFNVSLVVSKSKSSVQRETEVLPYIFVSLVILFLSAFTFYTLRNFVSEVEYKKAIVAASYDDFDKANSSILSAISKNRNRDYYHRQVAYVGLLTLRNNLTNKEDNKDKAVVISTNEKMINDGINNSITLNTYDPVNWETAAVIYKELVNISQGEAYGTETLQAVSGAIEKNPHNPDNYIILGYIYQFNRDEELQNQAEQVFYKAYTLQPSYPLSIFALGNYLEYVEKYDEALTLYETSIVGYYSDESEINTYLNQKIQAVQQKKAGKLSKEEQSQPTDEEINQEVEENIVP